MRRLAGARRPRGGDRRARGRRPRAGAADGRRAHRRARAAAASPGATRAAPCGPGREAAGADPGPACYGRGGERADRDRREPAAGAPRSRRAAGGRRAGSTARRPSARWAALAEELGLLGGGDGRGHRAGGQRRDGPGGAGGDRRARASTRASWRWWPSAARARCTPRRSPRSWAWRGWSRRWRRACCPRWGSPCPSAGATWWRASCSPATALTREAVAEVVERLGGARRDEELPRRRAARHLRPALRGPGVRAGGRGRRRAGARRPADRVRPRARATATATPTRDARAGDGRVARRCGCAARRSPGGARSRPRAARGASVASGAGAGARAAPGLRTGDRRAARPRVVRRLARDSPREVVMERAIDPIALQVMLGALRAACDEMGAVLVRSAHSANVKERRDASTALFDADGPHGDAGRAHPRAPRGDAERRGLGARRGPRARRRLDPQRPVRGRHPPARHHGDLAGLRGATSWWGSRPAAPTTRTSARSEPGSMPADSRTLEDEGVVIPPTRLMAAGELDRELLDSPHRAHAQPAPARGGPARPARRQPRRRRATRGAGRADRARRRCARASRRRSTTPSAARARAIAEIEDGERTAEDVLEGARRRRRAAPAGHRARRRGSSSTSRAPTAQHDGNLNCPLAVTLSACYLRACACSPTRTCRRARAPTARSTCSAPEGCLLNARPPAAVAAGNVETSSRVADLVLAAFGRALGQGTMNNLTLGNDAFTYYETLGGGQGACPDADGPSAVHVAMSNTLNTPLEALELEFPLRAVEYAVRRGLGRLRAPQRRGRRGARDGGARGDALLAHHRAPPARAAGSGTAASPARVVGTSSTARSCRRRLPARCAQATGCESRPPEVADMAEKSRVPGPRDHGPPDGRQPRARGVRGRWPGTARASAPRSWRERVRERDGGRQRRRGRGPPGIAISMVPDVPEVEAVLLGPDGAADGLPGGGLAIDMSTIAPTASRSIGKRLEERGFSFLDAPVTGSRPEGRGRHAHDHGRRAQGGLRPRASPRSRRWASWSCTSGPQGHGSMIKLINNTLSAINAAGLAEGIVLAQKAKLDVDKMLQVVGSGSGDSAMRALKSESMVGGRLRGAVQARAHAQGRALLHRRGAQGRAGHVDGAGRREALLGRRRRRSRRARTSPP